MDAFDQVGPNAERAAMIDITWSSMGEKTLDVEVIQPKAFSYLMRSEGGGNIKPAVTANGFLVDDHEKFHYKSGHETDNDEAFSDCSSVGPMLIDDEVDYDGFISDDGDGMVVTKYDTLVNDTKPHPDSANQPIKDDISIGQKLPKPQTGESNGKRKIKRSTSRRRGSRRRISIQCIPTEIKCVICKAKVACNITCILIFIENHSLLVSPRLQYRYIYPLIIYVYVG